MSNAAIERITKQLFIAFMAVLLLASSSARAQVVNKASADDFLENGVLGARVIAAGGVALFAEDASAVLHNPARLAVEEYPSVILSRATIFSESTYSYLLYSQHINERWGGFGVGLVQMTSDDFTRRDEFGNKQGTFDVGDQALLFSYGYPVPWVENLNVGLSYRMLNKDVDTYSSSAGDVTVAFDYRRWERWRFYAQFENIMQAGMDLEPQNAYEDQLPRRMRAGVSYEGLWKDRVRVGAEMVSIPDQDTRMSAGVDLRMFDRFWLGAGLYNQENISAGFEFNYLDFTVAYAFRRNADLERSTHLFELGWRPGVTKRRQDEAYQARISEGLNHLTQTASDPEAYDKAIAAFEAAKEEAPYPEAEALIAQAKFQRDEQRRMIEERKIRNQTAYEQGLEKMQGGHYLAAMEILSRVGEESEYYDRAQEEVRRAQTELARLQERDESAGQIRAAQEAFLAQDYTRAMALAEIILQAHPENDQIQRLKRASQSHLEFLARRQAEAAAQEAQAQAEEEQRNYLIRTYRQAMEAAWEEGEYDPAVVHAANLLALAPNDVRALEIKREGTRLSQLWKNYNLAADAYVRRDWSAAESYLSQAQGIPEETWQALKDRIDAAKLEIERRRLLHQTVEEKRTLALAYVAEQKYSEALAELTSLLSRDLEDEDRAMVVSDMQHVNQAIAQASSREERPTPSQQPSRATEQLQRNVQQREERLRENNEELIQNYLRNGLRAESAGNNQEAVSWYRRVLQLDPRNSRALSRINALE